MVRTPDPVAPRIAFEDTSGNCDIGSDVAGGKEGKVASDTAGKYEAVLDSTGAIELYW